MRKQILTGVAALTMLSGTGCALWWLPEGEPPTGGIVTNTPPTEYTLQQATRQMVTGLIPMATLNGCSGVPVGVKGELIVLPVWQEAAKALQWKRGEPDSPWQLESEVEGERWSVRLTRDGTAVWQYSLNIKK